MIAVIDSPLVRRVYGWDFDTAAPPPDYYCADFGSKITRCISVSAVFKLHCCIVGGGGDAPSIYTVYGTVALRVPFTHTNTTRHGKSKEHSGEKRVHSAWSCSAVNHYTGAYEVEEMGVWEPRQAPNIPPLPSQVKAVWEAQPNRKEGESCVKS